MRVGIVTTWADCGAGQVSLAYAQELTALGCEVAIYSRGQYLRDQRWCVSDQRPWSLELDSCLQGLTRVQPGQFARWLRRFRPDWLIFNEQRSWQPVIQARELGVRCAAYIDYYRADTVELFQLYDLLLCHTRRHYDAFWMDTRARYIPWGVDLKRFCPGKRQINSRHASAPLVVVHSAGMGGPSDRKGTDLALQAFHATTGQAQFLLHTQLPRSQWPNVWGRVIDADRRIKVLEGSIDPVHLYQAGDLYLYPSRLEGIGLTLPEALACGLAAITTDVQPMSEFVVHGITGSLVPVHQFRGRCDGYYWPEAWIDSQSLTAALQHYVDNPQLARSQGEQARAYMCRERNWSVRAREIATALEAEVPRPLGSVQLAELKKRARFQDRQQEPLTLDALRLVASCLLKAIRGRSPFGAVAHR